MNGLSYALVLAHAYENENAGAVIRGIAYTGAILHGLLLLGSIHQLLRQPKGKVYESYLYVGLAGLFGLTGNVIYYTIYTQGIAFWAIATIYHSLVWLSGLTAFISLGRALPSREKNTALITRYFGFLAYFWAAITSIFGIVFSAMQYAARGWMNSRNFNFVLSYGRTLQFCYFGTWGFVALFFILFGTIFPHITRTNRANLSIFAFGAFATIPVLTDTIVGTVYLNVTYSLLFINFVFTDVFRFFAMVVVLFCRNRWVITAEEQEDKLEVEDPVIGQIV